MVKLQHYSLRLFESLISNKYICIVVYYNCIKILNFTMLEQLNHFTKLTTHVYATLLVSISVSSILSKNLSSVSILLSFFFFIVFLFKVTTF